VLRALRLQEAMAEIDAVTMQQAARYRFDAIWIVPDTVSAQRQSALAYERARERVDAWLRAGDVAARVERALTTA